MRRTTATGLLLLGLMGASVTAAWAQNKRGKVITFEEGIVIDGKVQKPEAFYILQRSELNFKGLEPKKSFIPLILKTVEEEPF
ncbi:MAG: hypothetical protein KC613_04150 [Myxococcales bacterium]|nr:hypothetical protein [Myxococcales bacterium]MCB9524996.1 hypothetical protein [Myxococcales bacterium]